MNILKASLLAMPLLIPGIGQAQSDDEEAIRYYDVEIIIFKNIQAPKAKEFMLPVSLPVRDEEILNLSSPASINAAKEKFYELIPPENLRLLDKVSKIIESPYYELLAHLGWRQPGLEKEKVLPVWFQGGQIFGDDYISIDSQLGSLPSNTMSQPDDPAQPATETQTIRGTHKNLYELEGKITIALSRYLHTYTDLILRKPRLSLDGVLDNPELVTQLEHSPDSRILNNHSLKEHRRMRSKSLHYLDSPEFALLILITPYKKPDIDTTSVIPVTE